MNLPEVTSEAGEASAPTTPPAPPSNTPAAPPAATTVIEGEMTERELKLQAQLEAEKAARKKAEIEAGHHADEAHQLRQVLNKPQPQPKRVRRFMGFQQELD